MAPFVQQGTFFNVNRIYKLKYQCDSFAEAKIRTVEYGICEQEGVLCLWKVISKVFFLLIFIRMGIL